MASPATPPSAEPGRITPGSAEDLERHLAWLYPDPKKPCLCDSAYVNGGRLYGISMGKMWARTTTHPKCYHHGTEAQKFYDDNLRRFRKTGDWAEFHVDRDGPPGLVGGTDG